MPIHNPLPETAIDAAVDRLALAPGSRVLDVGSGTGDLLRRIVGRWPGVHGLGVDLVAAPAVHPDVELLATDASSVYGERFDLVCCVGALHAVGGFPHGYQRLAALAPVVLIGDGYWRREPDPRYLDALGAAADELPTRAGLADAWADVGLHATWTYESEVDDLTHYEESLLANADRHPDRSDVAEYASAIRRWRAAPGGTDTLGFVLCLLKPVG
jgi:SAM-dependent methyltransferase